MCQWSLVGLIISDGFKVIKIISSHTARDDSKNRLDDYNNLKIIPSHTARDNSKNRLTIIIITMIIL